jgi:hypothetical protein
MKRFGSTHRATAALQLAVDKSGYGAPVGRRPAWGVAVPDQQHRGGPVVEASLKMAHRCCTRSPRGALQPGDQPDQH